MSKEYLEAFGNITLHTEYDNDGSYDCLNFEDDCKLVDEALERLEQIDNADPSEAIKHMEFICKILKEKGIDVKWVFKEDYNTINKALLKAQTQEKEKLFFKNIHNTKVKTPLVSIFEGLSQDERHKFTEHLYYHWEEMKEALEDKNEELIKENTELKAKAQKEHKALEIIKEYQVDVWLLKQCDYENYIRIRKEAMVSVGQIVNENGAILEDEIPEEYFDLVKRWIE